MQFIVVGVDGGGTKTRAVVADERGEILGEATGAASAVRSGQTEESAGVIAGVVRDALANADQGDKRVRVLSVGVAGVGREPERQALLDGLLAQDLADDVIVQTDVAIALEDAFGEAAGILLVAGTGSIAYGRGPAGSTARCGGWGPMIGDEGSGAWIGRRALSVVTAAADGREPETALTGAILTATESNETPDLIRWAAKATPALLASLAPVVLTVADSGDLRANSIVSMAVEELALHVRALARQLFSDERAAVPVALSGGLLAKGQPIRKRLEHRFKSVVPGAQVSADKIDPARGAVRLAIRHSTVTT